MELPKFILGDNTKFPTAIYVIHTYFPPFIINLATDEVEWLKDLGTLDDEVVLAETLLFYEPFLANYHELGATGDLLLKF